MQGQPSHLLPIKTSPILSTTPPQESWNHQQPLHDANSTRHSRPLAMDLSAQTQHQPALLACSTCNVRHTTLWRRGPANELLCNNCGLSIEYKFRSTRVVALHRPSQTTAPPTQLLVQHHKPQTYRLDHFALPFSHHLHHQNNVFQTTSLQPVKPIPIVKEPMICANCKTTTTPLWRRDNKGKPICNACGLYLRLHGKARPFGVKGVAFKRRNRLTNQAMTAASTLYASLQSNKPDDADDALKQQQPIDTVDTVDEVHLESPRTAISISSIHSLIDGVDDDATLGDTNTSNESRVDSPSIPARASFC
ncbi:hypothetical protein CcCBS67573_g09672 [Chytriomyces confervae]|uniref:GATA-type domain-containing protein n=1 Tax=Chytriomyces confervae TaxID=246404 RepID=A0A507DRU4_9FUNG|nr:hypothetical protein CcCBS67573_g09672 [Chytriomyces confervae]